MIKAIVAVLVLAWAWAMWWITGATVIGNSAASWLDTPPDGLIADAKIDAVQGFPFGFDLTLAEPFVASPAQGWGVQLPALTISTPAYAPWSVTAIPAAELWIDTPTGGIAVTGEMAADLALSPRPSLSFAKAGVTAAALTITADQGWAISARTASARLDQADKVLTLHLAAGDLAPPLATPDLPAVIADAQATVTATLATPIDRFTTTPPAIEGVTLSDSTLTWGDMVIAANGQFTPDANGLASGKITITITHWRPLVGVLLAIGAVTPQTAPTLTNVLIKLEEQGGTPDQISLPLVAFAGRMILGPLPIGPAPRLRP